MRSRKWSLIALAIAVVALAATPPPAAAQDAPGAVTWVSFVQAKPGQSNAVTQSIIGQNSALYSELMEEGHILGWGIGQPIVHTSEVDYSHAEWVIFKNWAGVNAFVSGFMAAQADKTEEQRMAEQEAFQNAVEPGSHHDLVLRTIHRAGAPKGRPGYLSLAFLTIKPGQDFMALHKDFAEPVFAKSSADGAVGLYGVDVPEVHGDEDFTHVAWYELPDLGSRDVVEANFAAAEAARGEEGNAALGQRMRETLDWGAHRDQILVIVHHAMAGGGQEGED